jgi:hypothetical protein
MEKLMKKLIIPVVVMVSMISCKPVMTSEKESHSKTKRQGFSRVEMAKQPAKHGVYDPSVEYDDKGVGWLSYSSIEMPKTVQTDLAKSTNGGRTWEQVTVINPPLEEEIACAGRKQKGVWRNEVSSIVYDRGDPGREWKIFWHKYFASPPYKPKNREFECGWIAYRYASKPEGPWSQEIPLFGAKQGFPPAPFKPRIMLNDLHPDLRNYLVYSEPAALYKDGLLYLSLEGSESRLGMGKWSSRKSFLLVSHDHGKTWKYVGKLLDYKDARKLGYVTLTGESLFIDKGRVYLMSTPAGSLTKSYKDADGLYIFEFEDIKKAKLKRTKSGELVVHKYISPGKEGDIHGGHGDYDEKNKNGRIIMGQVKKPGVFSLLQGVKPFRIMSTGEKP